MATIQKRGDYQWRAEIRVKGYPRQSKTFDTKKEAETWATIIESEMKRGIWQDRSQSEATILDDVINLYCQNVLPIQKGGREEASRCKRLSDELGSFKLSAINNVMVANWRDKLSKTYKPATVVRYISLLAVILKHAQTDLGIFLPNGNPCYQIRKPTVRNQRTRRLEDGELERLINCSPKGLKAVIAFAIATAMRREEILKLTWQDLKLREKYAFLPDTKNSESRKVPLTDEALEIVESIPRPINGGLVFGYTHPDSITTAFTRACEKAGIINLHFHDLRHEAISRAFECGLNVMEAAAVSGHKELKMLQRYTHLQPSDIADKLNKARNAC